MKSEYLFAYGTLLPNRTTPKTADLMRQLEYVGTATVKGRLYDLGEYPGAILDPGATSLIYGVIYRLPRNKAMLAELDLYEEVDPLAPHANLFARTKCSAKTSDGRIFECWIYTYNGDVTAAPLIPGGNYAELKAS